MTVGRVGVVFLGGGLGACARAVLLQAMPVSNSGFPLSVLVANLLGSFLLGVVFVLADEAELMRTTTRLFVAVGVLGGFTTFSTFGYGADRLIGEAHPLIATLYVVASLAGGVLAIVAGMEGGREIAHLVERSPRDSFGGRDRRRGTTAALDMDLIETDDRGDAESA